LAQKNEFGKMNNGDKFDDAGFEYFLKDKEKKEWKQKYQ